MCIRDRFGYAIDHHAATAADGHPARPAESQRTVKSVLDVLRTLQTGHVVGKRDFVNLQMRFMVALRVVAQNLDFNGFLVLRHWILSFPGLPFHPQRHTLAPPVGTS